MIANPRRRRSLEHGLAACAASGFATRRLAPKHQGCFAIAAECNSAGHTDLQVFVANPQQIRE
jgi:hypothetical protein